MSNVTSPAPSSPATATTPAATSTAASSPAMPSLHLRQAKGKERDQRDGVDGDFEHVVADIISEAVDEPERTAAVSPSPTTQKSRRGTQRKQRTHQQQSQSPQHRRKQSWTAPPMPFGTSNNNNIVPYPQAYPQAHPPTNPYQLWNQFGQGGGGGGGRPFSPPQPHPMHWAPPPQTPTPILSPSFPTASRPLPVPPPPPPQGAGASDPHNFGGFPCIAPPNQPARYSPPPKRLDDFNPQKWAPAPVSPPIRILRNPEHGGTEDSKKGGAGKEAGSPVSGKANTPANNSTSNASPQTSNQAQAMTSSAGDALADVSASASGDTTLESPLDRYAEVYVPLWLKAVNEDDTYTFVPHQGEAHEQTLQQTKRLDYDAYAQTVWPAPLWKKRCRGRDGAESEGEYESSSDGEDGEEGGGFEDGTSSGSEDGQLRHRLPRRRLRQRRRSRRLQLAASAWLPERDSNHAAVNQTLEEMAAEDEERQAENEEGQSDAGDFSIDEADISFDPTHLPKRKPQQQQQQQQQRDTPQPARYAQHFLPILDAESRFRQEQLASHAVYAQSIQVYSPAARRTAAKWDPDGLYSLPLPGIREERPRLFAGDRIHLRPLASTVGDGADPPPNPSDRWLHLVFECRVTAVRAVQGDVVVSCPQLQHWLGTSFPSVEAVRFNVVFVYDGRAIQDAAAAVRSLAYEMAEVEEEEEEDARAEMLKKWLFPSNRDVSSSGPQNIPPSPPRWFDPDLNPEQRAAVTAIATQPHSIPFLLSGPPGTGKTKTSVEAILQIVHSSDEHRILVVAPSNAASDVLALRLARHLRPGQMFRLNDPTRTFAEVPQALGLYTYIQDDAEDRDATKPRGGFFALPPWKRLMRARVVVTAAHDVAMLLDCGVASNSDVTALQRGLLPGLLSGRGGDAVQNHWTHLLVDEAAQGTEPDLAPALACVLPHRRAASAVRTPSIILVGDPAQLGPTVRNPECRSKGLDISLLERLARLPVYAADLAALKKQGRAIVLSGGRRQTAQGESSVGAAATPHCGHLIRNYRARHPALLHLPSTLFYADSLVPSSLPTYRSLQVLEFLAKEHGGHMQGEDQPKPFAPPLLREMPLLFVDVRADEEWVDEGVSWCNDAEAREVVRICQALVYGRDDAEPGAGLVRAEDIAVISPFREQVWRVRLLLRRNTLSGVSVGPVEAYQGQESPVVILSTVRSRSRFLPRDAAAGQGLVNERKRLNVALTRAREALIVVGNAETLAGGCEAWRRVVGHARRNGWWVPSKESQGEVESSDSRDGEAANLGVRPQPEDALDEISALEFADAWSSSPTDEGIDLVSDSESDADSIFSDTPSNIEDLLATAQPKNANEREGGLGLEFGQELQPHHLDVEGGEDATGTRVPSSTSERRHECDPTPTATSPSRSPYILPIDEDEDESAHEPHDDAQRQLEPETRAADTAPPPPLEADDSYSVNSGDYWSECAASPETSRPPARLHDGSGDSAVGVGGQARASPRSLWTELHSSPALRAGVESGSKDAAADLSSSKRSARRQAQSEARGGGGWWRKMLSEMLSSEAPQGHANTTDELSSPALQQQLALEEEVRRSLGLPPREGINGSASPSHYPSSFASPPSNHDQNGNGSEPEPGYQQRRARAEAAANARAQAQERFIRHTSLLAGRVASVALLEEEDDDEERGDAQ